MGTETKNNFVIRTLSGILLLVVVLAGALISYETWTLLILTIGGVSMWEFYGLAAKRGLRPNRWLGIVCGILAIIFIACREYTSCLLGYIGDTYLPPLLCLSFAILAVELFRKNENPLENIAATILGMFYIAVPLGLLLCIPKMHDIVYAGGADFETGFSYNYQPWVALWYIFIIWMNDIGAYIIGVAFGRHRLFERISPKKSWEGFFGGLLFGIGTGVAAAFIMGWNVWFWAGLAAVAVVTGVFGDLIESMFKRAAGVKDSGNLIPGHGGMLDRFDALIFSAPFIFVYFLIFA